MKWNVFDVSCGFDMVSLTKDHIVNFLTRDSGHHDMMVLDIRGVQLRDLRN